MPERCKERNVSKSVYSLGDNCKRPATRDGYCTFHHPESVSRRSSAQVAKWQAEEAEREARKALPVEEQFPEAFRIRDLIARAICPDEWAEYDAGNGVCSNMAGWAVTASFDQAGRVYRALYAEGIDLPEPPPPAKQPEHLRKGEE